MTIQSLLVEHMPLFCYQTTHEVMTMLESVDENIDISTRKLSAHLTVLYHNQKIEKLACRDGFNRRYNLWIKKP